MLEIQDIESYYDKSHILHGVSLEVGDGETVGLLGRNGVGKSTTLKSIIGIVTPRSGSVGFGGTELVGRKTHEIARLGIGYVPEDRRIFPTLTVRQNLLIGMKSGNKGKSGDSGWSIDRVYECFPRLKERDDFRGGTLSGGEQQMLTIGRTLMGNPRLILLDEPMEGLAPQIVETVASVIEEIRRAGIAVLLVEQSIEMVLGLAQRVVVMNKGEIVFRGTPEELRTSPEVIATYIEV
jgi:branched-chain amino acid transport system ATP-binding protein